LNGLRSETEGIVEKTEEVCLGYGKRWRIMDLDLMGIGFEDASRVV